MNTREEIYHTIKKEMAGLKVAERLVKGEKKVKNAAQLLVLSTR